MQRLLMIEDDARLAAMVREYLGPSGFEVAQAADGEAHADLERLERSRAADERDGRVWLGHALLYAWWVIRHQLESSNKKVKPRHGNV